MDWAFSTASIPSPSITPQSIPINSPTSTDQIHQNSSFSDTFQLAKNVLPTSAQEKRKEPAEPRTVIDPATAGKELDSDELDTTTRNHQQHNLCGNPGKQALLGSTFGAVNSPKPGASPNSTAEVSPNWNAFQDAIHNQPQVQELHTGKDCSGEALFVFNTSAQGKQSPTKLRSPNNSSHANRISPKERFYRRKEQGDPTRSQPLHGPAVLPEGNTFPQPSQVYQALDRGSGRSRAVSIRETGANSVPNSSSRKRLARGSNTIDLPKRHRSNTQPNGGDSEESKPQHVSNEDISYQC